jgi:hypothetical protein
LDPKVFHSIEGEIIPCWPKDSNYQAFHFMIEKFIRKYSKNDQELHQKLMSKVINLCSGYVVNVRGY